MIGTRYLKKGAAAVMETPMKVMAVRLTLTARPDQTNQDVKKSGLPLKCRGLISLSSFFGEQFRIFSEPFLFPNLLWG
jgi:hypothetical protein